MKGVVKASPLMIASVFEAEQAERKGAVNLVESGFGQQGSYSRRGMSKAHILSYQQECCWLEAMIQLAFLVYIRLWILIPCALAAMLVNVGLCEQVLVS